MLKFPETDPELGKWLNGSFRARVELGYAICYLVSEHVKSTAAAPTDYRWVANSLKVITTGLSDFETVLQFETNERTYTFESRLVRELLADLSIGSGFITLQCPKCNEPFDLADEDSTSQLWMSHRARKCRRCGAPYDSMRVTYDVTEYGSNWMKKVAPMLPNQDFTSMLVSMTKGTRLLLHSPFEQFHLVNDFLVKLSELGEFGRISYLPPAVVTSNTDSSLDTIYVRCLFDLRTRGEDVPPNTDNRSISTRWGTKQQWVKQLTNYGFTLLDPLNRLITNPSRASQPPYLPALAGQIAWYFSGSNDLAPVLFYNPRAKEFTDEEAPGIIRGSDYGYRLLGKSGNQIAEVIKRLREDRSSRRTFCNIHESHDNLVVSNDIQCPIGIAFQVCNGKLNATGMMRSNNAYTLLPFNVMFFTLLQELVAIELGLPLGSYDHFAVSLHYFEGDKTRVDEAINATDFADGRMQPLQTKTPLDDVKELVVFEKKARESAINMTIDSTDLMHLALQFRGSLRDLALLILMHCIRDNSKIEELERLREQLDSPLRPLVNVRKLLPV